MDMKVLKSQWDRAAAVVLTIAGAICLIAGYLGVSDSAILAEQTRLHRVRRDRRDLPARPRRDAVDLGRPAR